MNNALDGEGPFSPERAGSLPAKALVNLCFSGEYTKDEILKMISGKGGVFSHLGTTDMIEAEKMMNNGDEHAKLVINAMIYHIAKAIAEKGAVLCGKIDAITRSMPSSSLAVSLTGSTWLTSSRSASTGWLPFTFILARTRCRHWLPMLLLC